MDYYKWINLDVIPSRNYKCGYCGYSVAPEKGWAAILNSGGNTIAYIYICHHCTRPTFFDSGHKQFPGVAFGEQIEGIGVESVELLYNEARNAMSVNSFTAVVLCCRKLLMHIAVSKGAKPGDCFVNYVQYLSDQHYIPPDAKEWVDHIREKGNEANHEINIMEKDDAELLITFIQMLLRLIFEFPSTIKKLSNSEE